MAGAVDFSPFDPSAPRGKSFNLSAAVSCNASSYLPHPGLQYALAWVTAECDRSNAGLSVLRQLINVRGVAPRSGVIIASFAGVRVGRELKRLRMARGALRRVH